MSRSNGSGPPPPGWPADYPPAHDPYQDPYYSPQHEARPDAPRQSLPPQAARPPRMQPPAQPPASRTPQPGLPQGGLPAAQGSYGQPYPGYTQPTHDPRTHDPRMQDPRGYATQPPAQAYPREGLPPHYAGPQHAQPAPQQTFGQAPAGYPAQASQHPHYAPAPQAPVPRTAPPTRATAPPPADPRYGAHPSYDAAPALQQPVRTAPPYGYGAPTPQAAYIPETTGRPTQPPATQPPQQRAPQGYESWPIAQAPASADPRGYDLGTYMPSPGMPGVGQQGAAATSDPRQLRAAAAAAWPDAGQTNPAFGSFPVPTSSQAMEPVHDDADYEDMEDEDEPPRRTRYGLIAASLIGAIAVGGGLAYTYKIYATPPVIASVTPVIKNGSAPNKVKPSDPGGTKFANTDSKMMDSLARAQASGDASTDGAPKKVQTMTVERDGSITTSALPSPPQAPSTGTSAVPGMIVIGAPPPPAVAAPQPLAIQPPGATVKPAQRIAAASPPAAAYPDAVDPAATAPAAAPKKPVPAAKKPIPPSAVGGPTGANGFVAVLASVPASANSRMQAMQQFADLQQKYAVALGGKAPDVVEAKLEKGTFHRLVVGPPASRDAAGTVCTQLKAAGYTADCWVTAF